MDIDPGDTPPVDQPSDAPSDEGRALIAEVYGQLRAMARRMMARERDGHTLQATDLVNEVYLRLAGGADPNLMDPKRFYFAAAEAMKRVLIDHARRRGAEKRGGGRRVVEFDAVADLAADASEEQILAFEEALLRFEEQWPDAAAVVRLRFYAGLSVQQTAEALGSSPRSVNRSWRFARAWLYRELGGATGVQDG